DTLGEIPPTLHMAEATGEVPPAIYPLAALALEKARGHGPSFDFLHPRRTPPPQSQRRTLVLAAATAAVLLLAALWQGYTTLQAPLRAAENARAELAQLEEMLPELEEVERHT